MNARSSTSTPAGRGLATALILLALATMYADARGGALAPVRRVLATVLHPVQLALNWPGERIRSVDGYFDDIARLRDENQMLRTLLTQQAGLLSGTERLRRENQTLRQLAELRPRITHPGIVAEVQPGNRTPHSQIRLLDKGEHHGVLAGQPVIDASGVVGQITRVYPFHSEMTLITDPGISVPITVRRTSLNTIAFGGTAPGQLELRLQTADADLRTDDVLLTSGLDALYPPGLPVGRIRHIDTSGADPFSRITIEPAGNVNTPALVLVLRADEQGVSDADTMTASDSINENNPDSQLTARRAQPGPVASSGGRP